MEQEGVLHWSHEMISFQDSGKTKETQLEAGTNSITTTGRVINWITSLNWAKTESLQSEITVNTTTITRIQEELTTLGVASIVNGMFEFMSQIISTSALAAEIAKCMKIKGKNNLTGNISSSSNTN